MFPTLEFETGEEVPCSKIVCIARNYTKHIKELNNPIPEAPVFFMKPNTALAFEGSRVLLPSFSKEVDHEVELAIIIGKSGFRIPEKQATHFIYGYAVAIDLTARDMQKKLKKKGYPWEMSKAFDQSCPISKVRSKEEVGPVDNLEISLYVNQEKRQGARTGQMIYNVSKIISAMSYYFTLHRGDILLTGTPEGVGRLVSGDVVQSEIEKVGKLSFEVV